MELFDWIDAAREAYLTIKDVLDMPAGTQITLVCLDRNVSDTAHEGANAPYVVKNAKDFLSKGYHIIFTKGNGGISGELTLRWWEGENNYSTVDIEGFHIEHPNGWYPFRDNPGGYQWVEFPENTCLGWRGPAIPIERMDQLPQLVFRPDSYDNSSEEILRCAG